MKTKIFAILILLFGAFSHLIGQENDFPGEIEISLNGIKTSNEGLIHQVFCLNGGDELEIRFVPSDKDTTNHYALLGLNLWAQIQLGRPDLVGKIEKSDPAWSPSIKFQLKDLQNKKQIPEVVQAIRGSLQLQGVLKVEGNRMIAMHQVPSEKGIFYLSMIQNCQGNENLKRP